MRVTPRGGRDSVEGVDDSGELRVRVRAAPADGAANAALIQTVAKALGVPPSAVGIVRGAAGRHKLVGVDGVEPGALRALWPGLAVSD